MFDYTVPKEYQYLFIDSMFTLFFFLLKFVRFISIVYIGTKISLIVLITIIGYHYYYQNYYHDYHCCCYYLVSQ